MATTDKGTSMATAERLMRTIKESANELRQ
jgi:hypothetical protein